MHLVGPFKTPIVSYGYTPCFSEQVDTVRSKGVFTKFVAKDLLPLALTTKLQDCLNGRMAFC